MKYFVKFFVVTFFLLICTHTFAEQKIVVLDLSYVLNNSKAGKDAQEFLKKSFKETTKKFSDIEESLKKEESDLLAKKTTLSKDEYTKKMNSLRKRSIEYQTQKRAAIDKITTQRAEAREALLNKVDPILKVYIAENSISLVADRKFILGGAPDYDITKVIVERLNKELPSLNLK